MWLVGEWKGRDWNEAERDENWKCRQSRKCGVEVRKRPAGIFVDGKSVFIDNVLNCWHEKKRGCKIKVKIATTLNALI